MYPVSRSFTKNPCPCLSFSLAWDGPAESFGEVSSGLHSFPRSFLEAGFMQGMEGEEGLLYHQVRPWVLLLRWGPSSQRALCPQLPLAVVTLSSLQKGTMGHCAEHKMGLLFQHPALQLGLGLSSRLPLWVCPQWVRPAEGSAGNSCPRWLKFLTPGLPSSDVVWNWLSSRSHRAELSQGGIS